MLNYVGTFTTRARVFFVSTPYQKKKFKIALSLQHVAVIKKKKAILHFHFSGECHDGKLQNREVRGYFHSASGCKVKNGEKKQNPLTVKRERKEKNNKIVLSNESHPVRFIKGEIIISYISLRFNIWLPILLLFFFRSCISTPFIRTV